MSSALTDRGGSSAWRRIRAKVLARDGNVCGWCGGWAREVDHITARALGGTDDLENLVASCQRCNNKRGQATRAHLQRRRGDERRAVWYRAP